MLQVEFFFISFELKIARINQVACVTEVINNFYVIEIK